MKKAILFIPLFAILISSCAQISSSENSGSSGSSIGSYTESSSSGSSYTDSSSSSSESIMSYTVTWKNYDGTVLEIDEDVKQGAMPHYDGVTPEKGGNAQYSYSWTGWTPEIQTVVSDITYFAVFDEVVNKYTVTWKNYDGTVLEIDGNVPYGDVPSFDGITPTRISDDEFEYAFSEWSPSIEQVTADIIYVAQFSSNKVGYKIIKFLFAHEGRI
jgi:hypothetical protein